MGIFRRKYQAGEKVVINDDHGQPWLMEIISSAVYVKNHDLVPHRYYTGVSTLLVKVGDGLFELNPRHTTNSSGVREKRLKYLEGEIINQKEEN